MCSFPRIASRIAGGFFGIAVATAAAFGVPEYQTQGVVDSLPVFTKEVQERTVRPLSWTTGRFSDFEQWKDTARAKVLACMLEPPPSVPWDASVIEEEDRGSHVARKIIFNLTGDSRVLAYMTVPKGKGPFPAVLLLHDHGARFDIGKEKVIRPWNIDPAKEASAREWVDENYGGRFIGDELASRGYVCLSTDALNWSDRGGGGYDGQQELASNLMHLGMSLAGLLAWEDLRAAEFLVEQHEVARGRIAAMGWSMGAYRSWQMAALSPYIDAAVAICWMSTVDALMVPRNNQTRGSSSYNMLHPGLLDDLDYPDIASIACPKPVLFFNGMQDKLFPVAGVEDAYAKMRTVWESQSASNRLVTKIWNTPHAFNKAMQEEAFAWLDSILSDAAVHGSFPDAEPGLIGIVYGDTGMTRPAERLTLPQLDERVADWPKQRDGAIVIRGSITSPVRGWVELRVETAHHVRLVVGGEMLLEVGAEGGSGSMDFRAGVPKPIVVEYVQPGLPAKMRIEWRLPGSGDFEAIPESALMHDHSDLAAAHAAGARPAREDLLVVANPNPARLATLQVWQAPGELMVEASIPSVPGFTCNSWCYEGHYEFVSGRDLGDGRLELRHRLVDSPGVVAVTTMTPAFDSVDIAARLEREDGRNGPIPASAPAPNLCWQLKASSDFASEPDPYPEFFARCFIFTEAGRTFLDKTTRRKIPARPADDLENNPPWVQIYGPASEPSRRSKPGAWADYAAEGWMVPVVGTISRDKKSLAAIAAPDAASLCQAWHDCMHINARSFGADREWRLKIYAMKNDPAKLLERVRADFPTMAGGGV